MKKRDWSIGIYHYEDKYIFCGTLYMYFEKYRGGGPAIYSEPILVLPNICTPNDIKEAINKCVEILMSKEEKIFEENSANDIMKMEGILFKNFKLIGIKASKKSIQKNSILVEILINEKVYLIQECFDGKYMIVQKEVEIESTEVSEEIACEIQKLLMEKDIYCN